MNRDDMLGNIRGREEPWDLIIIGGGATGLGSAVDAASRGLDVVLLEQSDFAKGTSSRSTKLIHGGVRYLQQGNVSLVMEALKERGRLLNNAPHLVDDVAFIVPSYKWWESPFYGIGMKVYDLLAGRYGFGKSSMISRDSVVKAIPSIQTDGLMGGTKYYDGQFDDARLAINLATTAFEQGGTVANYVKVVQLLKDDSGMAEGVVANDEETGEKLTIRGRVVVNATGPFADTVRRLDHPDAPPIIAPSSGVHIVLDRSFLPGDTAIMVPHTDDGRVMFAIPWHDVAVVGTTDTPIKTVELEPIARNEGRRVHPQDRQPLPVTPRHARRHTQRLRRHPAARQDGGWRGYRRTLARSHDPDRPPFRPDDRRGRQVDDLPQDGAGCRGSGYHARRP